MTSWCRLYPETRECPLTGCEDLPCARFEDDDESRWALDIQRWERERVEREANGRPADGAPRVSPRIPAQCYEPNRWTFMFPAGADGPWLPNLPGPLERLCMSLGPSEFLFLGPDILGPISGADDATP